MFMCIPQKKYIWPQRYSRWSFLLKQFLIFVAQSWNQVLSRFHEQIGPNVSISANVRIGAGARLINCIVLDDVEVQENAVVINSIVGWKSSIGKWSRVQADGDYNAKLGITILGEAVIVEDEVVINSIVLPNKTLNLSVQEEIFL
ncbi:mannose-1-phosphate guanyltransferase 1-like [Hibiscus syriacus]|uniref:mannose-1-phosphate guanyltransferase 1-like n=1 Tax=Hibiscus syriacus TaxID=106335 RepID=UPI00192335E5|nr:mannose-1-phosphate guanyltransferase 1-like [Hibiscus syriacus]